MVHRLGFAYATIMFLVGAAVGKVPEGPREDAVAPAGAPEACRGAGDPVIAWPVQAIAARPSSCGDAARLYAPPSDTGVEEALCR
jgi:hypothetical protein